MCPNEKPIELDRAGQLAGTRWIERRHGRLPGKIRSPSLVPDKPGQCGGESNCVWGVDGHGSHDAGSEYWDSSNTVREHMKGQLGATIMATTLDDETMHNGGDKAHNGMRDDGDRQRCGRCQLKGGPARKQVLQQQSRQPLRPHPRNPQARASHRKRTSTRPRAPRVGKVERNNLTLA